VIAGDRPRLALAVASGCVASALLYPLLRVAQLALFTEPDPTLVLWSEHSGFFWRSWIAAYGGGAIAFAAWLLAGRAPERTARGIARAVTLVVVVIVVQATFAP